MKLNATNFVKKGLCLFITLLLLYPPFVKSQNANQYSFVATSGTFTSIVGQTGVGLIPTIHNDDGVSNGIVPFQFSFTYCGNTYVGFKVCSNGWVSFSNTSSTVFANSLANLAQTKPALMPLWDNLSGASGVGSSALFITTGTSPNRVFTYECNNWRWSNVAAAPVISFQIKLYETTNDIEFIYRPESGNVTNPASATIGICDGLATPTFLTLNNASSNPTASTTAFTTNINARPANGQIYRFSPPPLCTGVPPAASVTPLGPINVCVASPVTLSSLLVPPASGVTYQWEESTTGTAPWNPIAGATQPLVTFNPLLSTYYRLVTTCASTSQTNFSNSVLVNVTVPSYASIPYFQNFETWGNYCSTKDVPQGAANNWRNNPATGDSSWRREDEGSSAGWSATFGAYSPASVSGLHSARFSSSSVSNNSNGNVSGNLDLYLDCSTVSGDKALYFYYINPTFGQGTYDSLRVSLSTNGGNTFTRIGVMDSSEFWTQKSLPIQSNSSQTILRLSGYVNNFLDFTDMGVDSLYIALPCTGKPAAGTLAAINNTCAGASYALSPSGTSLAGGLSYIWQQSTNGGGTWTTIPGATNNIYKTPSLYDTIRYRMIVTCNGSSLSDTTNQVIINITPPQYALTPYTESFENWVNSCAVSDVPSLNWVNSPAIGDNSWRRNDQGATTWSFMGGDYSPASKHLSHSARFHSWNTVTTGSLELFVDCSLVPGNKELQFFYINPTSFQDSLKVFISTDGGLTFSLIGSYADELNWALKAIPLTTTSAQTILRFQAQGDGTDDIGIDYVRVLNPCVANPVAGTVDSVKVCSGQNFQLSLTGTSAAAGLSYQWQSSTNNITWTNVVGGNTQIATGNIATPTYFRAIVTCTGSGLSDTSNSQFFDIAPFYYCYCTNVAQSFTADDIGNVTVRRQTPLQIILNNGTASPLRNNATATNGYSDFTGITPFSMHQGAGYNFRMTAITQYPSFFGGVVSFYVDLNRDGVFNPTSERVVTGNVATATQIFNANFVMPTNLQQGITGMRVVMETAFGSPNPCTAPLGGEVEDYLVYIDIPVCNGAVNPGTAILMDTLVCANQNFMVIDTSHEKQFASINWIWQSSSDNINWTDLAGTDQKDTLLQPAPSANTYYRLKLTCATTSAVSFSNEVLLKIQQPYFCYCKSYADGGSSDVSDLGAFSIGSFIVNSGGAHLSNPGAVNSYTTNDNPVTLYRDSTYSVNAYHIIKNAVHQDAKVTLFIDYDNNLVYDIPAERVWTGYTSATAVFVNNSVTIPTNAVKNVMTGMRLIINNDVNPNVPSDEACGTYTSGETEDYIVMIRDKNDPTSVLSMTKNSEIKIFPNPSDGIFDIKILSYVAEKNIKIRITDLSGREVMKNTYPLIDKEEIFKIDLSSYAKGIYMAELITETNSTVHKLLLK